jgi:hypothetical protein
MRGLAITFALALTSFACAHPQGTPDAEARARALTPGVSTLADAKALLGEPSDARDYGDLGTCTTWTRTDVKYGMTTKSTFLFLCFAADGTLVPGLPTVPRRADAQPESPP